MSIHLNCRPTTPSSHRPIFAYQAWTATSNTSVKIQRNVRSLPRPTANITTTIWRSFCKPFSLLSSAVDFHQLHCNTALTVRHRLEISTLFHTVVGCDSYRSSRRRIRRPILFQIESIVGERTESTQQRSLEAIKCGWLSFNRHVHVVTM